MITEIRGKATIKYVDNKAVGIEDFSDKEKKLYDCIKNASPLEYAAFCEKEKDYYFIENLSDIRANIVRVLPIKKGEKVLEAEAGTGAVTVGLFEKTDNITVMEENLNEAGILTERFYENPGLTVYAGNKKKAFECIAADLNTKFDWIIIKDPADLEFISELISETGRIVLLCENKIGIKYLSGNKYGSEKDYFTSIEGRDKNAYTLNRIVNKIRKCGFSDYQLFFPYPDYRFMRTMFSGDRMPKPGECAENINNLQSDRMVLFNELRAIDAAVRDGSFALLANAYMFMIGGGMDTVYARFSNERDRKYSIYTTIEKDKNGNLTVEKRPLSKYAYDHIRNLKAYEAKLLDKYSGSGLSINRCTIDESDIPVARFEYVDGETLSELMDRALFIEDDEEKAQRYFERFIKIIGYNDEYKFTDLDVVFSNIFVKGDKWTLTDYEWCVEKALPVKKTAYRAYACYLMENPEREKLNKDLIIKKLGLSSEAAQDILNDEAAFQESVRGKNLTLMQLRDTMGRKSVNPIPYGEKSMSREHIYKFKVYRADTRGSFSESNSFYCEDAYVSDDEARVLLNIEPGDLKLRLDPLDSSCIVTVKEVKINDRDYPIEHKKLVTCNGVRISDDSFLFATDDPNLIFDFAGQIHDKENFFYIDMEIMPLKPEHAEKLIKGMKRKWF
jgi:hypothetical protein